MAAKQTRYGNVKGNVTGGSVSGDNNIFGENFKVINNTIQLNTDEEGVKRLKDLLAIKTEVRHQQDDSVPRQKDFDRMKRDLSELIGMVKHINQKGKEPSELNAGTVQLSQAGLLLKKAVLLKLEADQLLFDQIEKNKSKIDKIWSNNHKESEIDLELLMSGFNETGLREKLAEARDLLEEANRIEPANVEVILHLAQVIGQLEPEEPQKERKLLGQVLSLLRHPKNETEWFQKAEATFLMATAGDETHPELLKDAREMFEKINRRDWVRQCDDLLASVVMTPDGFDGQSHSYIPQQEHGTPEFHPVDQWHVSVNDGTVIDVYFYPNGMVQGSWQNTMLSQYFSFSGQWYYIPQNKMLQIQGMTNMGTPVIQSIVIRGYHNQVFLGIDMNGYEYQFRKR